MRPPRERARILKRLKSEAAYLFDEFGPTWYATRRGDQCTPPGDWRFWLVLAGRGWGKTRTGAEFIRDEVMCGRMRRVALVGRTAADVRDVMIEGPSGILAVCARLKFQALYEPSKRRITFGNGAVAIAYSAEEPNLLRGPEHDGFWCDELAAWRSKAKGSEARNLAQETWDNLQFGFRVGNPRGIITTTPRPVPLVKALLADIRTHVTRGSTFDNAVNLAKSFIEDIRRKYDGTRLGRQELYAEVLEDVEGALWHLAMIDEARVIDVPRFEVAPAELELDPKAIGKPRLQRIVVAIDPSATHGPDSDFTGIVVIGLGLDGDLYVLWAEAVKLSPNGWANRSLDLAELWGAGTIVIERNTGGEMAEQTLKNAIKERQRKRTLGLAPRIKTVVATKGKLTRAEPVAALYEQGRVHHVSPRGKANPLAPLEEQMCVFPVVADDNDDLVDALVWGAHEMMPAVDSGTLYVL